MIAPEENVEPLPAYLQDTYEMICAAYPHEVPEADYDPLLVLLGEGMSQRNLAHVLAQSTGKNYYRVYNDVLRIESPFVKPQHSPEDVERVKRLLVAHGYNEWLTRE